MPNDPQWLMGALAASDAYRGDEPAWPEAPARGPSVLETAGPRREFGSYLEALPPRDPSLARQAKAGAAEGIASHLAHKSWIEDLTGGDPGTRELQQAYLGSVAEGVPKPEGAGGRYTRSIMGAVANPSSYMAINPVTGAAYATASGAGSEFLGNQFKGTRAEPWARALGGVVPYGAPSAWAATGAAVRAMPEGGIGIFGGRLAVTADQQALRRAEEMAKAGKYPDDIWSETGWFQGADKKWRFEIPDNTATLNKQRLQAGGVQPLSAHLKHPDLFAAYPQLRWMDTLRGGLPLGVKGRYDPALDSIAYSGYAGDPAFDKVANAASRRAGAEQEKSTLLHELQHAVQQREGFARGANLENAFGAAEQPILERIRAQKRALGIDVYGTQNRIAAGYKVEPEEMAKLEAWRALTAQEDEVLAKALSPYESYRRHAGEVEARNVQKRLRFTPDELREIPPAYSEDVLRGDQIVRHREPGALAAQDRYAQ